MLTSQRTGWLFGIGTPLLVVALMPKTITIAGRDYRAVLIVAILLTVIAGACFFGVLIPLFPIGLVALAAYLSPKRTPRE